MTTALPVNMSTEAEGEMLATMSLKEDLPETPTETPAAIAAAARNIAVRIATSSNDETKEKEMQPIPVTILSGFLGSGKTTLLKHILESPEHKMKVAVIVNDMAELNIDAATVRNSTQQVVQAEREIISLQNGCICCTLRGDLIREIARIRSSDADFDYLLIESTGIAEPLQVAQSFVFDPETFQLASSEKEMLWTQAKLDTTVTVIDAHMFLPQISTLRNFADNFQDGLDNSTPEGVKEGEKSICNLLVEQVEFADVILLNKIDLVDSKHQLEKTIQMVKSLNPDAKIISTEFSKVDLKEILNTGAFDMIEATKSSGWIKEIRKIKQDIEDGNEVHGEADEYGVNSFVYRARTPFHPALFARWLDSILHFANEWAKLPTEQRQKMDADPKYIHMQKEYGNIMRSKGFVWLAEHDSFIIGFEQSGRIGSVAPVMPWYTIIPKDQWGVKEGSEDHEVIASKFQEPHGDRRQELVFIGSDLKVDNIRRALDKCLLTKKELKKYKFYTDQPGSRLPN